MNDPNFIDRLDDYLKGAEGDSAERGPAAPGGQDASETVAGEAAGRSDELEKSMRELSAIAGARLDECIGSGPDRARALLEEAWNEFDAGRFDRALKVIESSLLAFVRAGASDRAGIATAFFLAAQVHMAAGNFGEALKALDDSEMWLAAAGAAAAKDPESVSGHMILRKRAAVLSRLDDLVRACEDMRLALIGALKEFGPNDPLVAYYYCEYGRYLLEAGRNEEAFVQFNGAVSLYQRLIEKHGYAVVERPGSAREKSSKKDGAPCVSFPYSALRDAYELLVLASAELGRVGLAVSYNDELKRHTLECVADDPELMAAIENTGGRARMSVNDFGAAFESFRRAADLLVSRPSAPDRDAFLADAYKGMGEALVESSDNAAAEVYLSLAAELYLGLIGPDDSRPVRELLSICDAYSNRFDDYEKTIKLYCRAIAAAAGRGFDNPLWLGRIHYCAGMEFAAYGAMHGAREHFRLSAEYYEKGGRTDLAERSMNEYCQIKVD